jgi:hypothetical protein
MDHDIPGLNFLDDAELVEDDVTGCLALATDWKPIKYESDPE